MARFINFLVVVLLGFFVSVLAISEDEYQPFEPMKCVRKDRNYTDCEISNVSIKGCKNNMNGAALCEAPSQQWLTARFTIKSKHELRELEVPQQAMDNPDSPQTFGNGPFFYSLDDFIPANEERVIEYGMTMRHDAPVANPGNHLVHLLLVEHNIRVKGCCLALILNTKE